MSTFGEWLNGQRTLRRLTREELAQRIGCSVAMLRKIEVGERRPSAQIAGLIANALDIPPAEQATFIRVARGELRTDRLPPGSGLPQRTDVSATSPASRNNLPVLPTPLIGRQRELTELHRLGSDPQCRLLTLVGPGGIGKTRLAIEVASQLQEHFADGVYFVSLASVDSARFIVPVIAQSVGYSFSSPGSTADPKVQLLSYLEDKQMLLLMDNMEHLLKEPEIELFAELLACAPEMQLLVTSREPLGLQFEWIFEVPGLPISEDATGTPIHQDTSIELFLQRARRSHVGFSATTDDYPAILRICRLLGGIPLAIELAAAWVRTLSCEEIAREIEQGLDFLKTSARDLPPRHRSMRAVFDHSWALLTHEERQALACLSVFRGGFGREAAAEVASAPLGVLSALVAKSLVKRTETGRYDLHELIRQYSAAILEADPGWATAVRQRHFAYCLALAKTATPQLKGSSQLEWLRRLELEHDNLRAALEWSLASGQNDLALQLAGSLSWFWQMRSYFEEGSTWLSRALEYSSQNVSGTTPLNPLASAQGNSGSIDRHSVARALEGLAHLTDSLGKHQEAHALAEQSAAICRDLGDKQGLADALMTVGQTLLWEGQADLGRSRLEEALALYREVGDRWNVARSLYRVGNTVGSLGDNATRLAMLNESSAILEELGGDKYLSAGLLIPRGVMAYEMGDYASAKSRFERSLSISYEIGDPWGIADALTNSGRVLWTQGDFVAARSLFENALSVYQRCGSSVWCADPLCGLAQNEIAQGNFAAAHSYLQEATRHAESLGFTWLKVRIAHSQGMLAYYEGDTEGARVSLEKALVLARESHFRPDLPGLLIDLARSLQSRGENLRARDPLSEGLAIFWKNGSRLGIATSLEVFAGLEGLENSARAVRCFSAAEAIRSTIGAPMPPADRADYERDVAAAGARLGEDQFAEAWATGQTVAHGVVVAEVLASLAARK